MGADEVEAYVRHRLGVVGWQGLPDFSADAFAAIHAETGGIPRRISQLANRLLLHAAVEGLDGGGDGRGGRRRASARRRAAAAFGAPSRSIPPRRRRRSSRPSRCRPRPIRRLRKGSPRSKQRRGAGGAARGGAPPRVGGVGPRGRDGLSGRPAAPPRGDRGRAGCCPARRLGRDQRPETAYRAARRLRPAGARSGSPRTGWRAKWSASTASVTC